MRASGGNATLGELMGTDEIKLDNIKDVLGEKLPELPLNRIGKYRLINSLKVRFGPGYRNIPGVSQMIQEFSDKVETENVIRLNKKRS